MGFEPVSMLHDHCHDQATTYYHSVISIISPFVRCRQMVQFEAAKPTTRVAKVHRKLRNTVYEALNTHAAREIRVDRLLDRSKKDLSVWQNQRAAYRSK